jgi:catechol 2,3-dioxygenase-like lactoylglutathione lyase family enzyme
MRGTALYAAGAALFVAGLIVGSVVTPAGAQQRNTGLRLNHVQITVPNLDESIAFYTNVMGFRVAFKLPAPADGRPPTTFVQINRDTFLEVVQATANVSPGITHIGLQTDDLDATVAQVRRGGVTVPDPRPPNGIGSRLATVFDPHGIRLEINEQPPGSVMRKAMDAWK